MVHDVQHALPAILLANVLSVYLPYLPSDPTGLLKLRSVHGTLGDDGYEYTSTLTENNLILRFS